jgi:glycosyltransferase involved in cell wall biosynthesis
MTTLGIDLLRVRPGCHGGGETYLHAFLEALHRRGTATLFCGPHNVSHFRGRYPEFTIRTGPDVLDPGTRGARLGETVWLMDDDPCDVLYFPLSTIWPVDVRKRTALTLFDVQHWDRPMNFTPGDRMFRDQLYRESIHRADVLHVPTRYTAERIEQFVPEAAGKLFVHPLFLPPFDAPSRIATASGYFHYPAIPWPHKNHALLFEAFARIPDRRLVLTGNADVGAVDLPALAEQYGIADRVDILGFLGRSEMLRVLAGSISLVYPSSYEGFGFPLVEAMALRRPILASDNTAIAEVAGDAALLLPPTVDAWAEALRRVEEEPVRSLLIRNGERRLERYSEEAFFDGFQGRIAG